MNTENMIEITDKNLIELVKNAYALSKPVGMGFLHYTEDPLTDEEANEIINTEANHAIVSMDYVKGRCCKFNVFKDENSRLWISDKWYDHSNSDLEALLDNTQQG